MNTNNIFDIIAKNWWEKKNICKPLHIINNLRFNYIKSKTEIKNKKILDLGCGGGILTEKLAKHGAILTALDQSKELINIAKKRNINFSKKIKYLNIEIINFLKIYKKKFDIIICMELLEHVEDKELIIRLLNKVLTENGIIILSSLNKNLITYIKMILIGEFTLKKLPKNTHSFKKLLNIEKIKLYQKNLKIIDIKEITYNAFMQYSNINFVAQINYILALKKC
jgi:2-polyprenyl-6-hydroxyphenyl methylase/3-demethylubiquinone-9 3-methyltransferase